jgi:hypothetical protein
LLLAQWVRRVTLKWPRLLVQRLRKHLLGELALVLMLLRMKRLEMLMGRLMKLGQMKLGQMKLGQIHCQHQLCMHWLG